MTPVPLDVLPGVRNHLRRIGTDLAAGKTCLWLLPTWTAEPRRLATMLEHLRRDVDILDVEHIPLERPPLQVEPTVPVMPSASARTVDDVLDRVFGRRERPCPAPPQPPPAGTPLVDRIYKAIGDFGCTPPDHETDPLAALAGWRAPVRLVLAVRADDEADEGGLRRLLERYPALAREHVNRGGRAPGLLIIGAPQSMPGLDRADALITATHWWWGVVRRLDMLVVADSLARPGGRSPQRIVLDELCGDLVPEIIAEVAGPDLDLAASLFTTWDGSAAHLLELARPQAGSGGSTVPPPSPALGAPPPHLWRSWTAGLITSWDGQLRPSIRSHPPGMLEAELVRRLWIAHSRTLNAVLDEIRSHLITRIVETAPVGSVTALAEHAGGPGVREVELGRLRKAVQAGVVRLDEGPSALLDTAVTVRNMLAHRQAVRDDLLVRLHRRRGRAGR